MAGLAERVRGFLESALRGESQAVPERSAAGPWRLGVAVSGGLDSVVLLDLILQSPPAETTLVVLHFDHALRTESAEDAAFVQALAERRGLECHVERWERAGDARLESRAGTSGVVSEDEARSARYRFFARAAALLKLDAITVAHTAEDQAETVLARLLRGSGRRGLAGMAPIIERDGYRLLRPLLSERRADLEQCARQGEIEWREDATNRNPVFTRNRIRHQVLPFLREHAAGDLVASLCRTASILREDEDYFGTLVEAEVAHWIAGAGSRRRMVQDVARLPPSLAARVFIALLEEAGAPVTRETVAAVRGVLVSRSRVDLAGGACAWVEDEESGSWLVIGGRPPEVRLISEVFALAVPGETLIPPLGLKVTVARAERAPGLAVLTAGSGGRPKREGPWRARAWFGGDCTNLPLEIRTRRDGDRMTPLGMTGTRKLHDLFIDEKIPPGDRDRWPLVTCGDRVLWVVGLRQDESTRVRPGDATVCSVDVEAFGDRDDPGLVA